MIWYRYVAIVFLATVFQISIIEQFVNTHLFLNVPLLIIIFYSWLFSSPRMLLLAAGMGAGQSYFDALPFGFTIILYVATAIIVQRLAVTFLTNKTTGSLLLAGVIGLLGYYLLLTIIASFGYGLTLSFLLEYAFQPSILAIQIVISLLLLFLFKVVLFRYEIAKA